MNVLLADDEDLARDRLRRLLAAFDDVVIVGEARDGEEAIQKVADLAPHAVFLDIEMPGASGLDVVRSLAPPRPRIVFCTGYDQYAVAAFDLHAVDYLLKPVTRTRLSRAVGRLREAPRGDWESAAERAERIGAARPTRFLARCGDRYRVVREADVEYFGFEDGLSTLHAAGARFLMDPSLNVLEGRLDPGRFFRVSRTAIVRLDAVVEVAPTMGGAGELRLRSGALLAVSRRRFRDLLSRLEGRAAGPGP
jgi:two-component system, LytTR family, response regulator